jgi:RHS repeat-associated protein
MSDAEVLELAHGLKNDPNLMYKFVHDHIHFDPTWGDIKGPYMTWMDRSGNAFDQASLMIALLTEAAANGQNVSNVKYVVGEIELTSAQFTNWFGLPNDANIASTTLARSGLYAVVAANGDGTIEYVRLEHVWVKATVEGQVRLLDPSFKTHTVKGRRWALGYDTNYNYTNFHDDALNGGDPNSYIQVSKTRIASDLISYANHLKSVQTDGTIEDVIGGRLIMPVDQPSALPTSLPYTVISTDHEFDTSHVKTMLRTKLRLQHCGIDSSFYSSDIYGRRLTLQYNGSNQPQLVLDGTTKATGNTTTLGQSYDLILSVDHPYDATDFDESTTIKVVSGGFYTILNGWGDTGTEILKSHRQQLQQYRFDGQSDSSEQVLGESFDILGLTWLAQSSQMRTIVGGVSYTMMVNHHMVGVAGQTSSSAAPYINVPLGCLGATLIDTREERSLDEETAAFQTYAGFHSAYQQEAIRQLQDCNAVSVTRLMEIANDRTTYYRILGATSYNWSSVQSSLHNYSQDEKDQITTYINAGFAVSMPEEGDLTDQNWTGMGFRATKITSSSMEAAYILGGIYGNGCASTNSGLSASTTVNNGYGATLSDGGDGTYTTGATDIAIGSGGYPFGLSFGRQYSSKRRLQDGPLGLGWTHSLDITALIKSDPFKFLGSRSVAETSPQIAAAYAVWQLLIHNYGYEDAIAALSESWMMDQMNKRNVVITQGTGKTVFTQDPNGSYIAPPGASLKLVVNNGNFRLKNSSGVFNDFDSNGRLSEWSDAHGNKVDFTYTSGRLSQVAAKIGGSVTSRTLSFSYSGNHITSVTDSASRSVSYTYSGNELHKFTNLDSNDVIYAYDPNNDGQLIKIYSPIDGNTPVVKIAYDTLGRMKQQTDANDCVWDFHLTPYRTEVAPPAQTDPNGLTKRFSTISWGNPDTRQLITTDAMGRTTTSSFDGLMRVNSMVGASGMSADLTYDQDNNVTGATTSPVPGSQEDALSVGSTYENYETTDGRWFNAKSTSTDPSGGVTRYEYDFDPNFPNDPNVGNLMKVTHVRVNPPADPNRATETFTYYSTGQIHTTTDALGVVTHYEYNTAAYGATLKKVIVDANGLNLTAQYTYDSVGRVTSVTDPLGNTNQTQYFNSGLVRKTIAPSPLSYEVVNEYYPDGKLHYVKTTLNSQTIYLQDVTYNSRGLKETTRGPYPQGATPDQLQVNYTQYFYDSLCRLWKTTDAEGHSTQTRYFPDNKVWKVIDANDNATVTKTYNTDGSLQKVQDAKGNATQCQYNGFMKVNKTTFADDSYEELTYDWLQRVTDKRTRNDRHVSLTYDAIGRVLTKEILNGGSPADNTITYKYDLTGRLIRTTDNTGTTTYSYDNAGRLTSTTDAYGKTVSYQYDADGRRTRLTYPDSSYVSYEYDVLGQLTKIKDSSGTTLAEYTYDALSRRTELAYANGTSISYNYDVAGRLLDVNNVMVSAFKDFSYDYDLVGNRTSMTVTDNGGVRVHVYTYDSLYQITEANYPDSFSYLATDTTFHYDAVGNRTTVVDGSGTASYTANSLNQYTEVADVNYTYDLSGNMTYDGLYNYYYDAENRLVKIVNLANEPPVENFALEQALDMGWPTTTGPMTSSSQPFYPVSWTSVYGGSAVQTGYAAKDNFSWMTTTVTGSGTVSFYWKVASEEDLDFLEFYIDNVLQDRISGWVDWTQKSYTLSGSGKHSLTWKYVKTDDDDGGGGWDRGFVDRIQGPGTAPPPPDLLAEALDVRGWSFTMGGASGWSRLTGSFYVHDSDGAQSGNLSGQDSVDSWMQTTVTGSGTLSFHWKVLSEQDSDYLEFYIDSVLQNRISGTVGWTQRSYTISGSGTHTLKWRYVKDDDENSGGADCGWVDWVQWSGTVMAIPTDWYQAEYVYDASGRRIAKAFNGEVTRKYVYSGASIIAEYDGNGTLLRKFVHGPPIDQPISMIDVEHSNATYYYHYDALGSVVALSRSNGTLAETYEYSVFGEVAATDTNNPNPYTFTGREFDRETGLYFYRARYYNPAIGRFLQTDPAQQGMNWYAYCSNNAALFTDPYGLDPTSSAYDPQYDPCLKILFYTSDLAKGNGANDPYFQYTFNVDNRASGQTALDYIVSIINSFFTPGNKDGYVGSTPLDKVGIAGIWIACHGGYEDGEEDDLPDVWLQWSNKDGTKENDDWSSDAWQAFSKALGAALDCHHGANAAINLRSCDAGYSKVTGKSQGVCPLLWALTYYSHHESTGSRFAVLSNVFDNYKGYDQYIGCPYQPFDGCYQDYYWVNGSLSILPAGTINATGAVWTGVQSTVDYLGAAATNTPITATRVAYSSYPY